ncbi:MAG TPA: hypothetical protein VGK73_39245 [Polyangiaceae bacterium]
MKLAFVGLIASGAPMGCYADIHDNTADVHDNNANIEDAEVEMTTDTDMDNVQPAQTVNLQIVAQDVFLIDPGETPPPDRVQVAGHFQIYFDSTSSEPLLITAEKNVSVTLPASASAGDHKLICRVHKHDGTPTEATFELDLKLSVSIEQ